MNLGNYIVPDECNRNVCVDVGANEGCFVALAKEKAFNNIYYIEANPIMFSGVQEKFPDIIGWNKAAYSVSNQIVSVVNHKYGVHHGNVAINNGVLNDDWNLSDVISEVQTVSLEDVLREVGGHINYLKCDCETSEYPFLFNKDLSKIDYIGLELHCQIGADRWNALLDHIRKTHKVTGNTNYNSNNNTELLCVNIALV